MYYESLKSKFESANKVTTITCLAEYKTCVSQRSKKNIIFV